MIMGVDHMNCTQKYERRIDRINRLQWQPINPMKDHILLITDNDFRRLEIESILRYQASKNDFGNESAIEWIELYAQEFRKMWQPFIFSEDTIEFVTQEMKCHRWIESEKCGLDLGIAAEFEWLALYGKQFRKIKAECGIN